jgi:hypothetical protein
MGKIAHYIADKTPGDAQMIPFEITWRGEEPSETPNGHQSQMRSVRFETSSSSAEKQIADPMAIGRHSHDGQRKVVGHDEGWPNWIGKKETGTWANRRLSTPPLPKIHHRVTLVVHSGSKVVHWVKEASSRKPHFHQSDGGQASIGSRPLVGAPKQVYHQTKTSFWNAEAFYLDALTQRALLAK